MSRPCPLRLPARPSALDFHGETASPGGKRGVAGAPRRASADASIFPGPVVRVSPCPRRGTLHLVTRPGPDGPGATSLPSIQGNRPPNPLLRPASPPARRMFGDFQVYPEVPGKANRRTEERMCTAAKPLCTFSLSFSGVPNPVRPVRRKMGSGAAKPPQTPSSLPMASTPAPGHTGRTGPREDGRSRP